MSNRKQTTNHFKVNTLGDHVATQKVLTKGILTTKQSSEAMHALLDFIDEHRD